MTNQTVQNIEEKISDIFYNICIFITIIALTMALIEFFTRGAFPSSKINIFYIGVLLLYSLHKEAIRWIEEKGNINQQRKGEYFVGLWIIITAILFLINFLTKDYFRYGPRGMELRVLEDISLLTLEVSAIFIFTRLLKIVTIYFLQKKEGT